MSLVLSMRKSLRYRGRHAIFRSICVQVIRLSGVDGIEMCRIDHCLLQLVEGSLMHSCPLPLKICLNHRGRRGCNSLEPFDKLLTKFIQPDKLSNFMNRGRQRPTLNDHDLFGFHVYSVSLDDVSAAGYSTLEECGFIDAGK